MMTTSETTELTLPDFDLGSQAQIAAATRIRISYIRDLVDRGFNTEDIQLLLSVRCVAKWWLDNKNTLTITSFTKKLASTKSYVTRHGTIELASQSMQDAVKRQLDQSRDYQKLSQPMYKYIG
jgi:hypothetical protein